MMWRTCDKFLIHNAYPIAQFFVNSLLKMICIIIAVAYFTIAERKVMAAIQRRKGPNVVGLWGLLQPVADGAKLLLKELVIQHVIRHIAHNGLFLVCELNNGFYEY